MENLSKDARNFAFTQNEKGIVNLTVGNEYQVFGIRKNKFGTFYLVLTDTVNAETPWWMPAEFFESIAEDLPTDWQQMQWKGYGKEQVLANPIYFDAMEDIEDATERGKEVFSKMKATQIMASDGARIIE